jgi:hypothetical protein
VVLFNTVLRKSVCLLTGTSTPGKLSEPAASVHMKGAWKCAHVFSPETPFAPVPGTRRWCSSYVHGISMLVCAYTLHLQQSP